MSVAAMTELMKGVLLKFVLPVCACAVTGVGSALVSSMIFNEKIDGRVTNLEVQIEKHEKALEKDFARHDSAVMALTARNDEHERRITRMETIMDGVQSTLSEIRADVKALLRERR